jgi:hypothetical protein
VAAFAVSTFEGVLTSWPRTGGRSVAWRFDRDLDPRAWGVRLDDGRLLRFAWPVSGPEIGPECRGHRVTVETCATEEGGALVCTATARVRCLDEAEHVLAALAGL